MQLPCGYLQFHPNVPINYQFNRWLPEAREKDLRAAALEIGGIEDVALTLTGLADQAEAEGRWLHAATYARGAEFFMSFVDDGKITAYRRYRRMFDSAFAHIRYERRCIPFEQGQLHALVVTPPADVCDTLVIHGGFDSYMEEFFQWAVVLSTRGFRVILFEGPGQGAAIRESNLTMAPDWERPVGALLDVLEVDSCTLIGFSLGGYLALRAAAYEPRIKRVVLINALLDFLGCFLDAAPDPVAQATRAGLENHNRAALNDLAHAMRGDANIAWALDHGEHISGSADSFEFFQWAAAMNTRAFSESINQPCLVTAGTADHIVPIGQFFEQLSLLRNSQALSARLYSAAEDASAHCQVGNLAVLFRDVERWLG